jgi:hypothetical protein
MLAAPGRSAFSDRHTGDRECDDRVGPPPAESRIEQHPASTTPVTGLSGAAAAKNIPTASTVT